MSHWNVSIDCGLCSAGVRGRDDDGDEAQRLALEAATAACFLALPAIRTAVRRRYDVPICPDCATEIAEMVKAVGPETDAAPLSGETGKPSGVAR